MSVGKPVGGVGEIGPFAGAAQELVRSCRIGQRLLRPVQAQQSLGASAEDARLLGIAELAIQEIGVGIDGALPVA